MTSIATIVYPFFEQGQLLRSSDLNAILNYVDGQNNLTRTQLFGAGILAGMEVGWDNQGGKLLLGKGIGISSKGYLFFLPEDLAFGAYEETLLAVNALLGTPSKEKHLAWKLSDIGTNALTPAGIADKCLLVFRELSAASVGVGGLNGLDAPAKKTAFATTFYLVGTDLLGELLMPPAPETGGSIEFNGLPVPYLRRVLNPAQIIHADTFRDAFEGVCHAGILSVAGAFQALENRHGQDLAPGVQFGGLQATLEAMFTSAKEGNGYRLPYFYEFLEDLVKAYEELTALGKVALSVEKVRAQEAWFPFYLLAGGVGNAASERRTPKYCAPGCEGSTDDKLEKARYLYLRLDALVQNAGFGQLPATAKITPGKSFDHPLSGRAIPFYYNQAVRSAWNYDLSGQNRSHLIPGYEPGSTEPPYNDPLLHDLERWGFFRVEGHGNLPLETALDALRLQRHHQNIPFDIVSVPLGAATPKRLPDTVFEDLEMNFRQLLLDWAMDLKAANQLDLLAFLKTLDAVPLHSVDLDALKTQVEAIPDPGNQTKYEVVAYLRRLWEQRVEPPVLSEFAQKHPGLEHLGGVQPGGTLVLVYDSPQPTGQPTTGTQNLPPVVVVADFALPYRCGSPAQQPLSTASKIFASFPADAFCANVGPKEIFTWPQSGGRVLVSDNLGQVIPGVATISSHTGRWIFEPAKLPEHLFKATGETEVTLQFVHSGQSEVFKTVKVSRLVKPGFELSAAWVDAISVQVTVKGIAPENADKYEWVLTFLKDNLVVGDPPPQVFSDAQAPFVASFDVSNLQPDHVHVVLTVSGKNGCSEQVIESAPIIDPNIFESLNPRGVKPKSPGKPGKPNDKNSKGDADNRPPELPPVSGTPASDTSRHLDVRDALHRRLDRYKERLASLEKADDGTNAAALQRASLFFVLPANKATTPLRYREFAERLLENFSALDASGQDWRRQLLEVLTHDFLDKIFALGETRFDAGVLPNRAALEQNGMDIGGMLGRWRGEEIGVEIGGVAPG